MRKFLLFFIAFLPALLLFAAPPEKKFLQAGRSRPVGEITVVAAKGNKLAAFAAEELLRALKKAGNPAGRSARPAKSGTNIFLGDCPEARAAGVSSQGLPPDGYRIVRNGGNVFIAGRDTPGYSPAHDGSTQGVGNDKGTLFGVYEFLERFADVRFYFPGEMGTLIPWKELSLPEKIDIVDYPAWIDRSYLSHWSVGGKWYPGEPEYRGRPTGSRLATCRFRARFIMPLMTNAIHFGEYVRRFRKTNPDYFARDEKGRIIADLPGKHNAQFCLSSGIKEEVYQDVKNYLLGRPAAERNLTRYDVHMFFPGYVNLTQEDGFVWCACDKCAKIALNSRLREDPSEQKKVSTAVWKFTCDIAARLKKEKVPGTVVMLAYHPYNLVPDCEIPDNVLPVVVVFPGPQGDHPMRRVNDALLDAWRKKSGGKILVRTWTGKYMTRAIPGVPAFKHNIVGAYFSARKEWFSGAFMDEHSDFQIFRVLNLYVFMKLAWNPDCDYKALIAEFFRRMFGAGGDFVRKYYDEMELIWDREIIKGTTSTGLGGRDIVAQYRELWTEIFTEERIKRFDGYFDAAEKAAQNDPDALKRIRFMREQVFDPVRTQWRTYRENQNSLDTWQAPVPGTVHLRPRKGQVNEVNTVVKLGETGDAFVFEADCEEPHMDKIVSSVTKNDTGNVWHDSTFEIFLNPSGDRKNYFQLVVNANGALDDYHYIVNAKSPGIKWNSGASVSAEKRSGSWRCRITVPKSALGNYVKDGFPVLFARHRVLREKGLVQEAYYYWSPLTGAELMVPDKWGTLLLDPEKSAEKTNLYRDGGFATLDPVSCLDLVTRKRRISMTLVPGKQEVTVDTRSFIRDGRSLRLTSRLKKNMHADLPVNAMKPGKRYRLSFFCRLENVQGEGLDVSLFCGPGKGFAPMRKRRFNGTLGWHRLVFDLEIPADYPENRQAVIITMRNATGDIWIDDLRVEEL